MPRLSRQERPHQQTIVTIIAGLLLSAGLLVGGAAPAQACGGSNPGLWCDDEAEIEIIATQYRASYSLGLDFSRTLARNFGGAPLVTPQGVRELPMVCTILTPRATSELGAPPTAINGQYGQGATAVTFTNPGPLGILVHVQERTVFGTDIRPNLTTSQKWLWPGQSYTMGYFGGLDYGGTRPYSFRFIALVGGGAEQHVGIRVTSHRCG